MILRRPYAFLIRHFKAVHAIIAILFAFLLYRTNLLLTFFREYVAANQATTITGASSILFNWMIVVALILLLAMLLIVLILMINKDKPVFFYLYNIVVCIAMIACLSYSNNLVKTLELSIVDVRTVLMIRDITMALFIVESISFVLITIRAIGFDVKKFNFVRDLQALEIDSSDEEEFEVELEFDAYRLRRGFNRTIRHLKYTYKENKFIILLIGGIAIAGICFGITLNVGVYNKVYSQSAFVSSTEFTMNIKDVYYTQKNYQAELVDETRHFIILSLHIKSNSGDDKQLVLGRTAIQIGDYTFYPTSQYKDIFYDLGNRYYDQSLGKEYSDYILVYEVPKQFLKKNMRFVYYDKNNKHIQIKLKYQNLDTDIEPNGVVSLGKTISFEDSVLKDSSVQLNSVLMKETMKINYNFCASTNECFSSYEYLVPSINANYDKAIIKLSGTLKMDESLHFGTTFQLYQLISTFGTITYEINGTAYKTSFSRITPAKVKTADVYLEVNKRILEADKVILTLKIRNQTYQYLLKDSME